MINQVILMMLVVSFSLALTSLFYAHVMQPTLQTLIRFKLFAERDRLRRLAIENTIDPSSFAYQHLESMINQMVNATMWYSVSVWLESLMWKRENPEMQARVKEQMARFDVEASDDLKQIEKASLSHIELAMGVNSPGWMLIASTVIFFRSVKRKFDGWNKAAWYRIGLGYRPSHFNGSATPANWTLKPLRQA